MEGEGQCGVVFYALIGNEETAYCVNWKVTWY